MSKKNRRNRYDEENIDMNIENSVEITEDFEENPTEDVIDMIEESIENIEPMIDEIIEDVEVAPLKEEKKEVVKKTIRKSSLRRIIY